MDYKRWLLLAIGFLIPPALFLTIPIFFILLWIGHREENKEIDRQLRQLNISDEAIATQSWRWRK